MKEDLRDNLNFDVLKIVKKSNFKTLQNIVTPNIKEVRAHKLREFYPWPAPSPYDYRLPYSVIHVPMDQVDDFLDKIVRRYIRSIKKYTLKYISQYSKKIAVQHMPDDEFSGIFSNSLFSRFVLETTTADENLFFNHTLSNNKYYKMDMTYVESVTPISNDILLVPTLTLFEEIDHQTLKVICIKSQETIYTPDSEQWNFMKTMVLQAATMRILISEHPRCHFPIDSIIGTSHCLFSKNNVVYQLLNPHFYMQLPLNFAVLYISKSVALNSQDEIYTPFPCNKEGFLENLKVGIIGKKNNLNYPQYKFRLSPQKIYGEYGNFLESYWWVIYDFVKNIIDHSEINVEEISIWADSLNKMINGFPNPEEILAGDNLIRVITSIIHNVSVEHSCDHYNYATKSRLQMPLRIRRSYEHNSQEFYLKGEDFIRHEIANEMYFKTHTLISLMDVEYDFKHTLNQFVLDFKSNLKTHDLSIPENKKFIPLNDIASSIQF